MAMTTVKAQCSTCHKQKIVYKCGGCSEDFCFDHLTKHRQTLGKQFDEIENDRDQLQQILIDMKENLKKHSLIQEIDQWEDDSIRIIQQTAKKCKQIVMRFADKHRNEIENKLVKLTDQIREIRQENEFNEIDLNQFQTKLTKLTEELVKPLNISIKQDSTSFIKNISVIIAPEQERCSNNINLNTKWIQHGSTCAGGYGKGNGFNQLYYPYGICIDDNQTMYIAECDNHRILEWKYNEKNGKVIAGKNGRGHRTDQLECPTNVVVDKQNNSLIISDRGNRRVIMWSRQNNTNGQVIISDIDCSGLTIDKNGYLYVSDYEKHEVRRWRIGDSCGIIVGGGNGEGDDLNQLNFPTSIFVDENDSVYVSDWNNHRVMKWIKGANEGIIVAGGNGQGHDLTQLSHPQGVIVDQLGHIYVVDGGNHRVMRWCKNGIQGNIVVGGNGQGQQSNQLNCPTGLSFDQEGNLYIIDSLNHRIQKFEIDFN